MKSGNSRVVGIAAAMVLALVGGFLLWQNSGDSESEATEPPAELVPVLVSVVDIPRGESAQDLVSGAGTYLRTDQIPADQVRPGALGSLDEVDELAVIRSVTARTIPSGVQVTAGDFVVPGQQESSALPNVDPNLFEMTVALEPQRVVGGTVRVGQYVAIVGSFDPDATGPRQTVTIAENVLVTNVQTEQLLSEAQMSNDPLTPSLAPSSRLYVTFGVTIEYVEKLAYAAEYGRIWLVRQGDDATTEGSETRERSDLVGGVTSDPDATGADGSDTAADSSDTEEVLFGDDAASDDENGGS
jgi:pilus assembly protein CpaB